MAKLRKTYGAIGYDPAAREWVVYETEPHISQKIKDVFRRISKTSTRTFRFPDDPLHCFELLWFMDRYPLRASKEDMARLKRGRKTFIAEQDEIEELLSGTAILTQYPGLAEGCELWEYQQIAVEMFRKRGFEVDHSTINRWVLAYAPVIEKRLRQFRRNLRRDSRQMALSVPRHRQIRKSGGFPADR